MARREHSAIGIPVLREWAAGLPAGAAVLDLGCGHGVPVSQTLIDLGLDLHGIDAAPAMVDAFRSRFPRAAIACEAVEHSDFFARSFSAAVMIGVIFLLAPETQRTVIQRVAQALDPGGRFLFTSPSQPCEWTDVLTGLHSVSLGADAYAAILHDTGLELERECTDQGGNHYYAARRPSGVDGDL